MQRKTYIDNIINQLTRLQDEIKAFNTAKLFDTNKISENILKDSNAQLIISILKDKIPNEVLKNSNVVLELSQKDKLFKF
ncbi:hypothetical protein [Mycoplasma capricolum]|uniref:Uncharacterized protein n=2 Tax=Mycoplasma capricolum subsp. capricolum TaxID=40479 RepID=A0A0C3A1A2_MYCCA|nr:hypothetical protein [Mycoplasma capricolum]ABC01664.1 conserved hypothetical protein [Mycoplasma capricolum subsp. capricolum ATCC 27343]KIM14054.1 hypothetical protein MCGM508_03220 [Mycoplasma capricolum subsp. capricolum]